MRTNPEVYSIAQITDALTEALYQGTGIAPHTINGKERHSFYGITDRYLNQVAEIGRARFGKDWASDSPEFTASHVSKLFEIIEGDMNQIGSSVGWHFRNMGYSPSVFKRAQELLPEFAVPDFR